MDDLTRKNARTGLAVLVVVLGMIGVSFAAVPLYSLFCRVTGFGGTTQVSEALPDEIIDREISIYFNSDTDRKLLWSFKPDERFVKVNLGERGLTAFTAENLSEEPVTGTALYNVTPLKVGKYFHKIQCFCFDEQMLKPHEKVSMPVMFYVDPALNEDPNMDDVTSITLSYTFYKAKSEDLDVALDAFYNTEDGE